MEAVIYGVLDGDYMSYCQYQGYQGPIKGGHKGSFAAVYYCGLRMLAYAWSFTGNYMVKDPDGVEKNMIRLDKALDYADMCLRNTMSFGDVCLDTWPHGFQGAQGMVCRA